MSVSLVYGQGYAPTGAGTIKTISTDTVQGAETVVFSCGTFSSLWETITIQVLCDDAFGGTSDGTITLQGSVDGTSWVGLPIFTGLATGIQSAVSTDTITISDAAVGQFIVYKNPYKYLRLSAAGTSGDTTLITGNYIYKGLIR